MKTSTTLVLLGCILAESWILFHFYSHPSRVRFLHDCLCNSCDLVSIGNRLILRVSPFFSLFNELQTIYNWIPRSARDHYKTNLVSNSIKFILFQMVKDISLCELPVLESSAYTMRKNKFDQECQPFELK